MQLSMQLKRSPTEATQRDVHSQELISSSSTPPPHHRGDLGELRPNAHDGLGPHDGEITSRIRIRPEQVQTAVTAAIIPSHLVSDWISAGLGRRNARGSARWTCGTKPGLSKNVASLDRDADLVLHLVGLPLSPRVRILKLPYAVIAHNAEPRLRCVRTQEGHEL